LKDLKQELPELPHYFFWDFTLTFHATLVKTGLPHYFYSAAALACYKTHKEIIAIS